MCLERGPDEINTASAQAVLWWQMHQVLQGLNEELFSLRPLAMLARAGISPRETLERFENGP